MLKNLVFAALVGFCAIAMTGATSLTFAPDAQAFGFGDALKKVGKTVKGAGKAVVGGAKKVGKTAKRAGKAVARSGRQAVELGRRAGLKGADAVGTVFRGVGHGAKAGTKVFARGARKVGGKIKDGAKCVLKGGCATIGEAPGSEPRRRDHRTVSVRDNRTVRFAR